MEYTRFSFDELYEQSHRLVLSLCTRNLRDPDDVLDAFQSVYCRVFEMLQRVWSPPQDTSVVQEIFCMTLRECDRVRKRREVARKRHAPAEELLMRADTRPDAREAAQDGEQLKQLLAGLADLSPEERQLLRLAFGKQLSHGTIAKRHRCSRSTVTRRLADAISHLKSIVRSSQAGGAGSSRGTRKWECMEEQPRPTGAATWLK